MTKPILICDIDGVIANLEHRLHWIETNPPNWDAFFDACDGDLPMAPVIRFLQSVESIFEIAYITGRPWRIRQKTVDWFARTGVPWAEGRMLAMRANGDFRPDHIVKWELFMRWCPDPLRVYAILEDRDQVVGMWRNQGFLCLQNKKGDY